MFSFCLDIWDIKMSQIFFVLSDFLTLGKWAHLSVREQLTSEWAHVNTNNAPDLPSLS